MIVTLTEYKPNSLYPPPPKKPGQVINHGTLRYSIVIVFGERIISLIFFYEINILRKSHQQIKRVIPWEKSCFNIPSYAFERYHVLWLLVYLILIYNRLSLTLDQTREY